MTAARLTRLRALLRRPLPGRPTVADPTAADPDDRREATWAHLLAYAAVLVLTLAASAYQPWGLAPH